MNQFISLFKKALESVMAIALGVLVVAVFLQVLSRMVFKAPLGWSEELSRFGFIWLVFLSSALAVGTGQHFRIMMFTEKLPSRVLRYFDLFADLIVLTFSMYLCWYGYLLTRITMDQVSPAMEIPMGVAYLALPVSGLLMTLFAFARIGESFNGRGAQ